MTADGVLTALLRLSAAFALALPVGWDQERHSRSAGLRTYPLLAVGVCGALLIGQAAMREQIEEQANVVYAVVVAFGFLGAVAPHSRSGKGARAALVWVIVAIGAAAAYGLFAFAGALALLTLAALHLPRPTRPEDPP